MTTEEWVLWYYKQGFNILPAKSKTKFPSIGSWDKWQGDRVDEETLHFWLSNKHFQNINLCLGDISGIHEIDVDVENAPIGLLLAGLKPNEVWVSESSSGKVKIFFKALYKLPNKVDTKVNAGDGHVELRSSGHLSVLPPSIHPSGAEYKWHTDVIKTPLKEIDGEQLYRDIVSRLRAHFEFQEKKKKETEEVEQKKEAGVREFFWRSYKRGDAWDGCSGHSFRLAFCAELINNGYNDNMIHLFFRKHDEKSGEDYSQLITQKKIDELRRKKMNCWKYETIKERCGELVE